MRRTLPEMDEIVAEAMTQALRERRHLLRRRYVWLPAPSILMGGRTWDHRISLGGRWGYTLRQARQMRKVLRPLLAAYARQLEAEIERMEAKIR